MNMSEKRILKLNPKWIHTINPTVLPWNGKEVTVRSWHSNTAATTKEMFPNDQMVGFIEEFCMDIPESELVYSFQVDNPPTK